MIRIKRIVAVTIRRIRINFFTTSGIFWKASTKGDVRTKQTAYTSRTALMAKEKGFQSSSISEAFIFPANAKDTSMRTNIMVHVIKGTKVRTMSFSLMIIISPIEIKMITVSMAAGKMYGGMVGDDSIKKEKRGRRIKAM